MAQFVTHPAPAVRTRHRRGLDPSPLPGVLATHHDKLRLAIDYVSPKDLKPPRRALKTYGKNAKERLKRSIEEFGCITAMSRNARSGESVV
jgi:hypothetical protein